LILRLEELLADESAEVVRYAINSAGQSGRREFVPELLRRLGDPRLGQDAADALERYGAKITGTLADLLSDEQESLEARKRTAVALGRVGNQEAADFLLWQLGRGPEDLNGDIIDALDRIRSGTTQVGFNSGLIMSMLGRELKRYYRTFLAEAKTEPGALQPILFNIFKLLGLAYAREDIFKAYQNWLSGTREAVAYALELLDNSLSAGLREALFPILEDEPLGERVRRFRSLLKNFPELRP
jgi:AAA family ATP:ADP antiporter